MKLLLDHFCAHQTGKPQGQNCGLLMQKLFIPPKIGDSNDKGAHTKNALSNIVAAGKDSNNRRLYKQALQRRLQCTQNQPEFKVFTLDLDGRLLLGTKTNSILEFGATFDKVYGMPIIPGSSLKGVLRQQLRNLGATDEQIKHLLGGMGPNGQDALASAVSIYDAAWLPTPGIDGPFVEEVLTPHVSNYLNTSLGASSVLSPYSPDDPVPIQQLACQGTFVFLVQGHELGWLDFAAEQLVSALCEHGVGSKTSSGYGRFKLENRSKYLETVIPAKPSGDQPTSTFQVLPVRFAARAFTAKLENGKIAQSTPSDVDRLCAALRTAKPELWQRLEKRGAKGKYLPLRVMLEEKGINIFIRSLDWDETSEKE
jgi:CRISPR type III-B/RAMP module RAMP protein Cmr6